MLDFKHKFSKYIESKKEFNKYEQELQVVLKYLLQPDFQNTLPKELTYNLPDDTQKAIKNAMLSGTLSKTEIAEILNYLQEYLISQNYKAEDVSNYIDNFTKSLEQAKFSQENAEKYYDEVINHKLVQEEIKELKKQYSEEIIYFTLENIFYNYKFKKKQTDFDTFKKVLISLIEFEDIIDNCIKNRKYDKVFEKYYQNLINNELVKELTGILINKFKKDLRMKVNSSSLLDDRKIQINQLLNNESELENRFYQILKKDVLKQHKFQQNPPEFRTFRNTLNDAIEKEITAIVTGEDSKDTKKESFSLDQPINEDNNGSKLIDPIAEEYQEKDMTPWCMEKELKRLKITDKYASIVRNMCGLVESTREEFDGLEDLKHLVDILKNIYKEGVIQSKHSTKILSTLKRARQNSPFIKIRLPKFKFSFKIYASIIQLLIKKQQEKDNNSKNTIDDFNMIRDYLSVLILNEKFKRRDDFCKKAGKTISTYETNSCRIKTLYNTSTDFLDLKSELTSKTPHDFSKVFDTHNINTRDIIVDFTILDVLQRLPETKLDTIAEYLFSKVEEKYKEAQNRFKKNTMLTRIKILSKYGFITINHDVYSCNSVYLNPEQKNALKYVVPFFCGCYPFSSIGHFLASRLGIEDKFEFERFNCNNILDDCISYDLMEAINKKQKILLTLKNKEKITLQPIELFVEKDSTLLKVKCTDKQEYFIHEFGYIPKDNLIFNEIYSFCYKIISEIIEQYHKYTQQKKPFTEREIRAIINKYHFYCNIINPDYIKKLLPSLAQFRKFTLPLTNLEQRWLKTIMQDYRFDLFVDNKETLFGNLVKDVEPFDLSDFKDINGNSYKDYWKNDKIKESNKKELRDKLQKTTKIIYSLLGNKFLN